ncbi:hypothetical protein Hdeb2414_s0013g00410771 [Helianthus debilis subsp. tardiflorus]
MKRERERDDGEEEADTIRGGGGASTKAAPATAMVKMVVVFVQLRFSYGGLGLSHRLSDGDGGHDSRSGQIRDSLEHKPEQVTRAGAVEALRSQVVSQQRELFFIVFG